jgi:putative lipoic acid-binding regulatory protein
MTEEEQRLIALLESQHTFPGPYEFKVIYRNSPGLGEGILAAITDTTGHVVAGEPSLRSSSTARFVAMTFAMELGEARAVLEVYAALKTLDSVVSYF